MSVASPESDVAVLEQVEVVPDNPWVTVLWDDDYNVIPYVVAALRKVLKKDRETCERFAMEADRTGRSQIFDGKHEEAYRIAQELGAFHLFATVEKAGEES